jgi:hypothetical protein
MPPEGKGKKVGKTVPTTITEVEVPEAKNALAEDFFYSYLTNNPCSCSFIKQNDPKYHFKCKHFL